MKSFLDSGSSKKKQLEYKTGDVSVRTECEVPSVVNVEEVEPQIKETEGRKEEASIVNEAVTAELATETTVAKPKAVKPFAFVAPAQSTDKGLKIQFNKTRPVKADAQNTSVFTFAAKNAVAAMKQGSDLLVKPVSLAKKTQNASSSGSFNTTQGSKTVMMTSKADREEKHKSLYKANRLCGEAKRTGMLKGVRLNKRFELQMAFRNAQNN